MDFLTAVLRGAKTGPTKPLKYGSFRLEACVELAKAGPNAKSSVPVLLDVVKMAARTLDANSSIYSQAVYTLKEIGDERALPVLRKHRKGEGLRGKEHNIAQDAHGSRYRLAKYRAGETKTERAQKRSGNAPTPSPESVPELAQVLMFQSSSDFDRWMRIFRKQLQDQEDRWEREAKQLAKTIPNPTPDGRLTWEWKKKEQREKLMADIAAKGMLGQHFVNSYYDQLADVILALGDEKKRGEILRSGDYILPLPPRDATPEPGAVGNGQPKSGKGKKATVAARMIDLIKDPATHTWTAEKFRMKLGCKSRSTITDTPAWKTLVVARESARLQGEERAYKKGLDVKGDKRRLPKRKERPETLGD